MHVWAELMRLQELTLFRSPPSAVRLRKPLNMFLTKDLEVSCQRMRTRSGRGKPPAGVIRFSAEYCIATDNHLEHCLERLLQDFPWSGMF